MTEKIFINDSESVTFDIPDEGAIGCFMSGGADSSLMCFILADLIVKHGLKTRIYPITAEMLARPYNLRCGYDVVNKVSLLTGFKFELHLCYILPNHVRNVSDEEKVLIHSSYTRAYGRCFELQTIYNGLTANPPVSAVPDTTLAKRQTCRDDINWRRDQQKIKGLTVPFIHVDKKGIGALYEKFNLLKTLLPLTRSCEAELAETSYFTKDCFDVRPKGQECWWCLERAYGFDQYVR